MKRLKVEDPKPNGLEQTKKEVWGELKKEFGDPADKRKFLIQNFAKSPSKAISLWLKLAETASDSLTTEEIEVFTDIVCANFGKIGVSEGDLLLGTFRGSLRTLLIGALKETAVILVGV